jgi:large subunit ribosomal protein L29
MDIDKVRALTDTELLIELGTQRRQLYDLRFQLATRQLTDHTQLTQTRRTIARVLTVMTERGIEGAPVPSAPVTGRAATRTRSRAKAAAADKQTTAKETSAVKTATATSGRGGKR